MRFGVMEAAAAAACVVAAPAAAVKLDFTDTSDVTVVDFYTIEQSGVRIQSDNGYPPLQLYGLHADDFGPGPKSYRISVAGRVIGVRAFTQTCCAFDDEYSGRGQVALYSAAGQLIATEYFGPLEQGQTQLFRKVWDGGSYLIFSGDHASINNLVLTGVPEPATWGLMILGFGAIGGALRRRPTMRLSQAR